MLVTVRRYRCPWLADRPTTWGNGLEVVAMDGFTGFKTATSEGLPEATAVMDPFPSSASPATPWTAAGAGSSKTSGHRSRAGDPLYRARRTLRTGADLLTDRTVSG